MAHFFIGQRVRVKGADISDPRTFSILGKETRITGDRLRNGTECWLLDIYVGVEQLFCKKGVAGDYLEPIVPPNHQACNEEFKRDLDRLLERQGIAA